MKWLDVLSALPNTGRVVLGSAAFLGIMMAVTKPKSAAESFSAESFKDFWEIETNCPSCGKFSKRKEGMRCAECKRYCCGNQCVGYGGEHVGMIFCIPCSKNPDVWDDDYDAESFSAESKPRGPYVFPKRKAFPIGDIEHAKRALVFAEWPNNKKNRAKVRRAVFKRYPQLRKSAEEFEADYMTGTGAIGGSDLGHDSSISLEYTKKALKDARRHIALVGSLRHRYERGKIKGMIDEVIQETYTLFPQDQWLAEGESFEAQSNRCACGESFGACVECGDRVCSFCEYNNSGKCHKCHPNDHMSYTINPGAYAAESQSESLCSECGGEMLAGEICADCGEWEWLAEGESFEADESICLMCGGPKGASMVYCDSECSQHSHRTIRALGGIKGRGYPREDIAKAVLTLKEYGGDMTANQWAARIRDVRPTRKELSSRHIKNLVAYLNPNVYVKTTGQPIKYRIVSGDCYADWVRERYQAETFDAEYYDVIGEGPDEDGMKFVHWYKSIEPPRSDCPVCGQSCLPRSGEMDFSDYDMGGGDDWEYRCHNYSGHTDAEMTVDRWDYDAEEFEADPAIGEGGARPPSDDDDDEPSGEGSCYICNRPYEFSKLAIPLAAHWFNESNGGTIDWKSKDNPEGLARTARNLAGYYLANFGTKALEEYIMELNSGITRSSKITPLVVELLRRSLVPSVMAGDVVQFIETLEIEGIDEEEIKPKFGKKFLEEWGAEE